MFSNGYIRVTSAVPTIKIADIEHNTNAIKGLIDQAVAGNSKVAVFPELSVTGYTCADLFHQSILLNNVELALQKIAQHTKDKNIFVVVGAPLRSDNSLYNCGVACYDGKILGVVPKIYLPNYKEFYEKRWFSSGLNADSDEIEVCGKKIPFGADLMFNISGIKTSIEICEDLWVPIPPSSVAALNGATLLLNLSATNELIGKHEYLLDLIKNQSAKCRAAYVYSSSGAGESSTDLVFTGNAVISENGTILAKSERFISSDLCISHDIDINKLKSERMVHSSFDDNRIAINKYLSVTFRIIECDLQLAEDSEKDSDRKIDQHPFVPKDSDKLQKRCEEIISIQTHGLMQRLRAINCKKVVIGISGGLDSTLALLIAVESFDKLGFDRKGIVGITMPGFGTTDRTYDNALKLMSLLGITIKEISISEAVTQHFKDIEHNSDLHDITYENSQARERTQILMDYANKINAIVLGTGDLSELALGWCTYNGDQISMYGVNSSVPKTLVKYLVNWFATSTSNSELKAALLDIIDTPISPELIPADEEGNIKQRTEDLVGPYELHDFFLYHTLHDGFPPSKILTLAEKGFEEKYSKEVIIHWLKTFYSRFFSQQFKRSCMPDGPKIGSACLSPRGDWRMPSDASVNLWKKELENL